MKTEELIEELKKYPGREVIIAEVECNYFNPLRYIKTGAYDDAEHSYGIEKLTESLRQEGYGYEDIVDGKPALLLSA